MGCSDFTGSLLTNFPSLRALSACGNPLCSALKPSRSFWIGGESRAYAAVWDTHAVSPPVSGTESSVRIVTPGGWCSYETSEWYPTVDSLLLLFRLRYSLSGPR